MILFALFLEIRDESLVEVSDTTHVAVGGTLGACVIIMLIIVAVLVIRY